VRLREFEWDDGNVTRLRSSHGVEPEDEPMSKQATPKTEREVAAHY
jgi:hypothetical protein